MSKQANQQKEALKSKQPKTNVRQSVIIKNDPEDKQSCLSKWCGWAKLATLQPYFNVTTIGIKQRMICAVQFWKSDFLKVLNPEQAPIGQSNIQRQSRIKETATKQYDIYGPFWIYTTLIFLLGAVHNILLYQNYPQKSFSYNFDIVGIAFAYIYSVGFGFPFLLTFVMKCFAGAPQYLTYVSIISTFGYSHCTSLPCILLCVINSDIVHYILILYAVASRCWFLITNIKKIELVTTRRIIILGLIGAETLLTFIMFKYVFIKKPSSITQTVQLKHLYHNLHTIMS